MYKLNHLFNLFDSSLVGYSDGDIVSGYALASNTIWAALAKISESPVLIWLPVSSFDVRQNGDDVYTFLVVSNLTSLRCASRICK